MHVVLLLEGAVWSHDGVRLRAVLTGTWLGRVGEGQVRRVDHAVVSHQSYGHLNNRWDLISYRVMDT